MLEMTQYPTSKFNTEAKTTAHGTAPNILLVCCTETNKIESHKTACIYSSGFLTKTPKAKWCWANGAKCRN